MLAGGHDKGIPFDELSVFDKKIKCCISFGETKEKFKDIFTKHDTNRNYERGFKRSNQIAQSGDVVLLSPACSSFDQYKNYEVRGENFKEFVKEYFREGEL